MNGTAEPRNQSRVQDVKDGLIIPNQVKGEKMTSYNTTTTGITAIASISPEGMGLLVAILFFSIIGCVVLSYALHSKLYRFFKWIGQTWTYFIYGVSGLTLIGIVGISFYYGGHYSTANNYLLLKIIGGIIVGYFVIAGFGWIIKEVYEFFLKKHKKIVKEYKKTKEGGR